MHRHENVLNMLRDSYADTDSFVPMPAFMLGGMSGWQRQMYLRAWMLAAGPRPVRAADFGPVGRN